VREILTLFPQAIEDLVKSGKTVTIENLGEFTPSKYVPVSRQKSSTKKEPRVLFKPAKNIRFKPGKDTR
jgi:nucleoid DNA-binding protein